MTSMGSIQRRGKKLYLSFQNAKGEWKRQATGLCVGQEKEAEKLLKRLDARVEIEREMVQKDQLEPGEAITLKVYAKRWLASRKARDIASVKDDETRLNLHVLPYKFGPIGLEKTLGQMFMADIRPKHVRDLVRALEQKGELAPRTIRHVYFALRGMMHDAQVDELVQSNPCVMKKGELPKKVDKDPSWRPNAIFTRDEVEQLLCDRLIPEDRRVLNGFLFLAGLRFGEAAAARWRSYDPIVKPLGKLAVTSSYSVRKKREGRVKTEQPREVPVHPTLAKILATWKLSGWERMMGRPPRNDDLIIPSREGANRSVNHSLKRFHEDLDRIGFRHRRQHDLRRSFISLARTDGARLDVLKWITHGPDTTIMDAYTTLPWPLLCEAISCLKIRLMDSPVVKLTSVPDEG